MSGPHDGSGGQAGLERARVCTLLCRLGGEVVDLCFYLRLVVGTTH